jgi:hypothetical protein
MANQYQTSSRRANRTKKIKSSSVLLPVLATGFLFAVVVGIAVYTVGLTDSSLSDGTDRTTTSAEQIQSKPVGEHVSAIAPAVDNATLALPTAADDDNSKISRPPESPSQPSPRDLVKAQLEAGEFGPAMDTARRVADASERAVLLLLISNAQLESGEFDAASNAISRIPVPEERLRAHGRRAARQMLAGGGAEPDFEALIALIMQETSGPWAEEDGEGGTISQYETGVRVNPNGLLHRLTREEETGRLKQIGDQARIADLNDDMARSSTLRLVSLTRLEREIARRLEQGQPVVATMKHLAGLSSLQYIFVYPEDGEIIIGGPAEGWRYDRRGLPRGIESGRPTLWLDDLVTVLRTFSSGGDGFFNCLIVPRKENMQALESYVAKSNARGPLRAGSGVRNWVRRLQSLLGEQDVVVNGIPLDSRAARVIVEADYRMKLIGINKLDGGDIRSYFDLLPSTGEAAPTATVGLRWWMQMKYDAVMHSPNRDVFEVQGSSVVCLSEDERIMPDGQRIHTGKSSPANRLFAQEFTRKFDQLAERDIVFADLQNVFDLSLLAALIHHERLDERVNWDHGVFAAGAGYRPARYAPPKTVESAANHRVYNGKDIVVQVAGGVRADLMSVVKDKKIVRSSIRLQHFADRGKAPQLPQGRWWWDAAK